MKGGWQKERRDGEEKRWSGGAGAARPLANALAKFHFGDKENICLLLRLTSLHEREAANSFL